MKKILLLSVAILTAMTLVFASCDKSDDVDASKVPQVVLDAFKAKYNATLVQWEKENGGLYKAEFRDEKGREVEAYFKKDGDWVKTETDLYLTDLPENIKSVVDTNWPDWAIDDVDFIELPDYNFYLIELEKLNSRDLHIRITPDGTILE